MPPPGSLPDPGMEPGSPTLQAGSSQPEPQGGGGHGAREELPWRAQRARALGSNHSCSGEPAACLPRSLGFPGGSDGKESTCNAGDLGSTPGLGFPGGGHDNLLQYSRLENPMDRGAWWATVQGVTQSQT